MNSSLSQRIAPGARVMKELENEIRGMLEEATS